MTIARVILSVLCCVAGAAGCLPAPRKETPLPPWPKLDTEVKPDKNVQPPAWYKPPREHSPWMLGKEPEHGTEAWRRWCALRYNSRDIVRPVEAPPKIDGKLDDAIWRSAPGTQPFVGADRNPASPGTTVWLAYDKDTLYVAVRADEPAPERLRASQSLRDAVPRSDDLFEMNFAPTWRDKAFRVYWFVVNPKGSLSDGLDANGGWNANARVAAQVAEKAWTFELAIPLKALGIRKEDLWGDVWACRFVRHRAAGGEREVSSWTRLLDAETGRSNWGHVLFKGVKPPEPEPKPKPKPEKGEVPAVKKEEKPE